MKQPRVHDREQAGSQAIFRIAALIPVAIATATLVLVSPPHLFAEQPILGYTPPRGAPTVSASAGSAEPTQAFRPAAPEPIPTQATEPAARSADAAPSTSAAVPSSGNAPSTKSTDTKVNTASATNPFDKLAVSDRGPIDIHSESLAVDYKGKSAWFKGNVHANQGDTALTSETLNVLYGDNLREIKQIIAQGNVKLVQGGRYVTGQHAVLNQVDRTVEITGNPVIHDGPDEVAGSRILIYLDTQKTQIDGARAMIFPRKSQSRDNDSLNDKGS